MADISKFCLLLLLRNLNMRVHLSTHHFSVEYNTLVVVFDGNNRQTRSYQRIKRTPCIFTMDKENYSRNPTVTSSKIQR